MGFTIDVVRVFTDPNGRYGNQLGIVDAADIPTSARQALAAELGYSETIFVDFPRDGSASANASIFTPAVEIPFAGHPTVGLSWWLAQRGVPLQTLHVPAGLLRVSYDGELTTVQARSEWAAEFSVYELDSPEQVTNSTPAEYSDDHSYIWAWQNREEGIIRSRMFAPFFGIVEDQATGSDAVRMTEYLSRSLVVIQGEGSYIHTTWHPNGWVDLGGRTVHETTLTHG
ncbi:MAG: PhzF family phenazine biosynthesis protein [Mycobacteriaceae bacterium]